MQQRGRWYLGGLRRQRVALGLRCLGRDNLNDQSPDPMGEVTLTSPRSLGLWRLGETSSFAAALLDGVWPVAWVGRTGVFGSIA